MPLHPYSEFVHRVQKPARYLGGEFGAVTKDWNAEGLKSRVCLAFPDVYDIGMSHLGFKILYKICLLYTSPSPRDRTRSRMPSSA